MRCRRQEAGGPCGSRLPASHEIGKPTHLHAGLQVDVHPPQPALEGDIRVNLQQPNHSNQIKKKKMMQRVLETVARSAPALHFITHTGPHPAHCGGSAACLLLRQRLAPHGGQAVVMDAVDDQPPPARGLECVGVVEDEEGRGGEAARLQGAALHSGREAGE